MKKNSITLLYDTCEVQNNKSVPKANGYPSEQSRILKDLQALNIDVNTEILSAYSPTSEQTGVYPIDLITIDFDKLLDNIDTKSIEKIKELNVPVLLYLPTEGFDCYNNCWLDYIHNQFMKYNMTDNSVYLIFGDLKIEKGYVEYNNDSEELLKAYKLKKVFPMSYFEWSLENYLKHRWSKIKLRDNEYVNKIESANYERPKDFLSYNGNFRPHRLAMVSELLRNKLCDNSLISFSGGYYTTLESCLSGANDLLSFDGRHYLQKYVVNWKPTILDYNKSIRMNYVNQIQKQHYLSTYYSVIAETEYSSKSVFLTEKTFKAIKSLHPFLIYGNPGTLKMLKELGYETFPEMFCEDYDNEEDHKLRLSMIIAEVKKFNNLSTNEKASKLRSVREKMLHNREHLETRASYLAIGFDDIFNKIIEAELNDKAS